MQGFCNDFYSALHMEKNADLVEFLKGLNDCHSFEELEAWQEKTDCYSFYFDRYWMSSYIGSESDDLEISCKGFDLVTEGKILMECYGPMFNFFSKSLKEMFRDHKLGAAIHVTISG